MEWDSSSNPFRNRSISLPTKSNPILARLEECTRVVREWQTQPHSLSNNGLGLLTDLCRSVGDFLRMVQTQHGLRGKESFVSMLGDDFLRLLDLCGVVKDSLVQMREHQQSLQSMFRRKDRNLSSGICKYQCTRKRARKNMLKCLQLLKGMDRIRHDDSSRDCEADQILRDVRDAMIIALEVLASIVSAHNSSKSMLWRLVTLNRSSRKDGGATESGNEMELLDETLFVIFGNSSKMGQGSVESAQRLMGSLEDRLREVEDELERVSRCLINARVILLNILTCC